MRYGKRLKYFSYAYGIFRNKLIVKHHEIQSFNFVMIDRCFFFKFAVSKINDINPKVIMKCIFKFVIVS